MVNILAFPGTSSSQNARRDSLDCETATPLVASTLDGTLIVARPDSPGLAGDWSNQELADLYRVEALLVQAGIRISTGRGLTDENDPWFVFCRDDGEVFVHLARSGDAYLLDSPGLGTLLEGPDFASLIDRFVHQVAARSEPENNVVRFRPRMLHDQKVRLHPAVMLAALVWTLYLSSDDLVGTAEAASNLATDGGYIPHDIIDCGADDAGLRLEAKFVREFLASSEDQTGPHIASSQAPGGHDRQLAGSQESLRTQQGLDSRGLGGTFSNTAVTPQAAVANLAVIAFGYGFHGTPALTDLSGFAAEKAAAALHLILDLVSEITPVPVVAQADGSPIELAADTGGKIESPDAMVNPPQGDDAPLVGMLSETPGDVHTSVAEHGRPEALTEHAVDQVSTEGAGQTVPLLAVSDKAQAATHEAVATSPVTFDNAQSVINFVSEHLGSVTQYLIGDVTVSATLDQEGLDKVLVQLGEAASDSTLPTGQDDLPDFTPASPAIEQQGKSILGADFASYDDQAKKFVHDFILDAGPIEMLQIMSELLLVDMTAIDEPTDHAFVRSWVTDDGYVISTIGHIEVFQDYGLA